MTMFDEPVEGDLVTWDHRRVYEFDGPRRPVLVVPEGADFEAAVRAWCDRASFWPDVWFISDHGNAHRIAI